jgi:putative hemolysin
VPGDSNISEVNAEYGLTIPEEDYTTVGGYVFGMLGRLPIAGDRVTGGGATFVVKEMEGRRIRMLVIEVVAGA